LAKFSLRLKAGLFSWDPSKGVLPNLWDFPKSQIFNQILYGTGGDFSEKGRDGFFPLQNTVFLKPRARVGFFPRGGAHLFLSGYLFLGPGGLFAGGFICGGLPPWVVSPGF